MDRIGQPYCGAPPLPGSAAWTLDPLLLIVLGILGAWLLIGTPRPGDATRHASSREGRREAHPTLLPILGWLVLAAALVSPLCSLAVALFSARVAQHLLIVLVAAPLLAPALAASMPTRMAPAAAAVFALVFWGWHLPAPYAATFRPDGLAWWAMHLSLLGSATVLWASLFAELVARPVTATAAALVTGLQMGALGALLTFAPRPLFAPHAPAVTLPWGFSPLEDQQLGGLLMWVPGGLLFVAVVLAAGLMLGLRAAGAHMAGRAMLAVALAALPGLALAQGNDATTAGGSQHGNVQAAAPVGVLTTTEVTTGSSGPSEPGSAAEPAPDADRRTRVLGPVCRPFQDRPALLAECRAKSGM